jgi:hypothetical protein
MVQKSSELFERAEFPPPNRPGPAFIHGFKANSIRGRLRGGMPMALAAVAVLLFRWRPETSDCNGPAPRNSRKFAFDPRPID